MFWMTESLWRTDKFANEEKCRSEERMSIGGKMEIMLTLCENSGQFMMNQLACSLYILLKSKEQTIK